MCPRLPVWHMLLCSVVWGRVYAVIGLCQQVLCNQFPSFVVLVFMLPLGYVQAQIKLEENETCIAYFQLN